MKLAFEKVQRPPGASIACIDFRGPAFDCPYHIHPEIEITHIRTSSGRRLIGDHLGEFAPGDLVIIGGGLPHLYFNLEGAARSPRAAQSRSIQFLPDCLGAHFFELPEMHAIGSLLQRAGRGLRFGPGTLPAALRRMDAVYAASGARRIIRFLELLAELARTEETEPLASVHFHTIAEHRNSLRIERALAYLNERLFDKVTLAGAARAASMSPQGFSRIFRRLMGRTFVQYLNELRIGAACRQLLETDATVAQVCFACGFNNLSNFNRRFQRLKGVAPSAYRREFEAKA